VYLISALILFGLVIEKKSIEWLTNRFGCTYFKLQKFIELDMRRTAMRYNWDNKAPVYEPRRYKENYFLSDFETLHDRFKHRDYKTMCEKEGMREEQSKNQQEYERNLYGDFVAHKIAVRIQDTIKFTLLLSCRSPDLGIDGQARKLLDDDDLHKGEVYGNFHVKYYKDDDGV
jgi:hypothetical protein